METNTGRITNNTVVPHTVRYVLRQGDTGGNVRFAYRCSVYGAAAAWTSVDMPPGTPARTKECVIPVPAFGSTTFSVSQAEHRGAGELPGDDRLTDWSPGGCRPYGRHPSLSPSFPAWPYRRCRPSHTSTAGPKAQIASTGHSDIDEQPAAVVQ
ncbi:hypothetical protein [Micromonospora schwarzwaldensis]|uniref:hypothetical protein n=1 Tax=Micromonospora sp. DSM 45708 TaxID=3111767 RepID=UPI0031DAE3B1